MICNRTSGAGLLSFLIEGYAEHSQQCKDLIRRCATVDKKYGGGHENAGTCQVSDDIAAEVLGALRRRIPSEG